MKIIKIVIIMIIAIIVIVYARINYLDSKAVGDNHKRLLGKYGLDLKKTSLGHYAEDSVKYQRLILEFYDDNTFKFNFEVPFILSPVGTWNAAGSDLDDWNRLLINGSNFSQVSRCCSADSTIMLNSTTPKAGQYFLQSIYFKKIHPKSSDLIW